MTMAVFRRIRILGRWALMLHGRLKVPLMATMLVTVGWKAAVAQPGGQTASPVVASRVVETNQPTSQSFVGTLMPIRKSIVGSAVDGRVVGMKADDGEPLRRSRKRSP